MKLLKVLLTFVSVFFLISCDKDEPKNTKKEVSPQDTTQVVEPVKCIESKDIAGFWINSDDKASGLKFVVNSNLLSMNKLGIENTYIRVEQNSDVALSCNHISISNAFDSDHQIIEEYDVKVEIPYLYLMSNTLIIKYELFNPSGKEFIYAD